MSKRPAVSVIIPAHNEEQNLRKLLPYLQDISTSHIVQLIVCLSADNSDESSSIEVADYARFLHCDQKGRAAQMNQGAALAEGNILAFLHADVLPPQTFFGDMLEAIDHGCDCGFFAYRFDSDRWLLKANSYFTRWDGIFTGGGDQCLFIRQHTFEEIGGFDESQIIMEDFEIFRRIKRRKLKYKILPSQLIVSARKYDHASYMKINLCNLLLVIMFRLGYSAQRLRSVHDRFLKFCYH